MNTCSNQAGSCSQMGQNPKVKLLMSSKACNWPMWVGIVCMEGGTW